MENNKDKFIETILNNLEPINRLSELDKNKILQHGKLMTYVSGAYVFQQGEHDDYTYYLLEGMLEMQSCDETTFVITTDTELHKYPLAKIQPRQYSARAVTQVVLLQIYHNVLNAMSVTENNKPDISVEIISNTANGKNKEDGLEFTPIK